MVVLEGDHEGGRHLAMATMRWGQPARHPDAAAAAASASAAAAAGSSKLGRPGTRWGHSLNFVKSAGLVFLFGGYGHKDCQTNQVHAFDIVKQTWRKRVVKGTLPPARDSHSCTTVGTELFVFGGTDGHQALQDLYVLDTVTSTWTCPPTLGETPTCREGHGAALVEDTIYVFGGCGNTSDGSKDVYLNDLYALHTATFTWRKIRASGTPPSARDRHSVTSYKNRLIVFGGEDDQQVYKSDVHILDTGTMTWEELATFGSCLAPRAGHTANMIGKHMIIFGGFSHNRMLYDDVHLLNITTGVWEKPVLTGIGPRPRFALSGEVIDEEDGLVFFYGGCDSKLQPLLEVYYLHTGILWQDEEVDTIPSLSEKPAAKMPAASACQQRTFEGRVSGLFHYGYTIEAKIDDKPFRGVLFSYKAGFTEAVHEHFTRKALSCKDSECQESREIEEIEEEEEATLGSPPLTMPCDDEMLSVMSDQYRELLGSTSNPFLNHLATI